MEITIANRVVGGFKALLQRIKRFIGCEKVEESHEIAQKDHLHQGEVHKSLSQLGEPKRKKTSANKTAKKKVTGRKSVGKNKKTSAKKKAKKKVATKKTVKKKKPSPIKKAAKKKAVKKKASKKKSRQ